jgi:hypothetical protein
LFLFWRVLGPLASRFAGVMEIFTSSRAEAIKLEAQRRRLSAWLAIDDHPTVAAAAEDDHRFVVCDPTQESSLLTWNFSAPWHPLSATSARYLVQRCPERRAEV